MRVKRQKRQRKSVRFYTACFGFREPFKVLCDGTFIHHLLLHELVPADQSLSNLLGGPTKLFASNCIIAELKSLGDAYSDSLRAARAIGVARCDHVGRRKSAASCIQDIVGQSNSEHFFVATQDADLRMKFQEVPGVPLIYGLRKSLLLEPLSISDRQYIKSNEEERLHMSELEHRILNKKKDENVSETQSAVNPSDVHAVLEHPESESRPKQRVIGIMDNVKFKRKRAKGPNPLSVKKKKPRQSVSQVQDSEDGKYVRRSRKRKRRQRDNNTGDSTN